MRPGNGIGWPEGDRPPLRPIGTAWKNKLLGLSARSPHAEGDRERQPAGVLDHEGRDVMP